MERKTELVECLVVLLFSDMKLSEEEREGICRYLSACEAELRDEVLYRYFESLPKEKIPEITAGKLALIAQKWAELAPTLGMNPDIRHYRGIRRAATRRPLWRRVAMRGAAVLLPVALAVGGYFMMWERRDTEPAMDARRIAAAAFVPSHKIDPLADGTGVALNHNATFVCNEAREELYGEDGSSRLALYNGAVESGHVFTLDHTTQAAVMEEFDTAVLFFKFGSVIGYRIAPSGRWNDDSIRDVSSDAYHNLANIRKGKGDPCRLVGMTVKEIAGFTTDAQLYAREAQLKAEGFGGWRLSSAGENRMFVNPNATNPAPADWQSNPDREMDSYAQDEEIGYRVCPTYGMSSATGTPIRCVRNE